MKNKFCWAFHVRRKAMKLYLNLMRLDFGCHAHFAGHTGEESDHPVSTLLILAMQYEGFWESSFSGAPAPQLCCISPMPHWHLHMVCSLWRHCIILHHLLCHYRGCQLLGHQLQMCITSSYPCDEEGLSPDSLPPLKAFGAAPWELFDACPGIGVEQEWSIISRAHCDRTQ